MSVVVTYDGLLRCARNDGDQCDAVRRGRGTSLRTVNANKSGGRAWQSVEASSNHDRD
jgi:hypothetical protein